MNTIKKKTSKLEQAKSVLKIDDIQIDDIQIDDIKLADLTGGISVYDFWIMEEKDLRGCVSDGSLQCGGKLAPW
jgi:hypothetical protein